MTRRNMTGENMNIVFIGTGSFAIPSLNTLIESNYKIPTIVTAPDKKKGRHLKLVASPVKQIAQLKRLSIFQPLDINSPDSVKFLERFNADLFVVINFGQILSKPVLKLPRIFCINIHASLLPKYRGAAPINWAIMDGERFSGITIINMNEFMDRGDIITQRSIAILTDDDALSLEDKLSKLGATSLLEALRRIGGGGVDFVRQNEEQATYAPKLKKQDGRINWTDEAVKIHNRVRGLVPWPGCFTYYKNKLLKIHNTAVRKSPGQLEQPPGSIIGVSRDSISVVTGKDILEINRLQLESGKIMDVRSFIAGHKIQIGEKLG